MDIEIQNNEINNVEEKKEKKIFLYEPEKKVNVKKKLLWYNKEIQSVRVTVYYLLSVPLSFEVSAITEGVKSINYTTTVYLKPMTKSQTFEVNIKPMESGTIYIRGISMGFYNLVCDHYVTPNGVGVYYITDEEKPKENICEIKVMQAIPKINVLFEALQLLNGSLMGIKNEKCFIKILIKNESDFDIKMSKLELIIRGKQGVKSQIIASYDLISTFGEIPIYGKWYKINQGIIITDKLECCTIEFHFGSSPEFDIIERYDIPVTIINPWTEEQTILPSLVCEDWKCITNERYPDITKCIKELYKKTKGIVISCSDYMNLAVVLKNLSPYPLFVELIYDNNTIAESVIDSQNKKTIVAETPYNINFFDNIDLKWSIPNLGRFGQNLIRDFISDKNNKLSIVNIPVKMTIESDKGEGIIKENIGNLSHIKATLTNISKRKLDNFIFQIALFKCTAKSYLEISNEHSSLAISGELKHLVNELDIDETYTINLDLLFIKRNVYKVAPYFFYDTISEGKCNIYVGDKPLTFEIY